MRIFIIAYPLANFEIQKYYKNEFKLNSVYSGNSFPKIKDGGRYVVNCYEYKSMETHWIALYVSSNNEIYFNSFKGEHIPKEIKKI